MTPESESNESKQVCHGIDQSTVNWDLVVMDPASDEDKTNNAKYAISVARKLGACVFVAAEDIVQVMSRMIMLFCASLWHCENERTASPDGGGAGAMPAPAALEQPPQVCAVYAVRFFGGGLWLAFVAFFFFRALWVLSGEGVLYASQSLALPANCEHGSTVSLAKSVHPCPGSRQQQQHQHNNYGTKRDHPAVVSADAHMP